MPTIGDRVEIPAHTDHWMAGDRYGEITAVRENSAGVTIATVDMDRSGKRRRFRTDELTIVQRHTHCVVVGDFHTTYGSDFTPARLIMDAGRESEVVSPGN